MSVALAGHDEAALSLEKTKQILWGPENIGRIKQSTAFDSSHVDCQIYMPIGLRVSKDG